MTVTQPTDHTQKFLGSMVGTALGDAIGEMAFRLPDEAGLRSWIARLNPDRDPAACLVYTDDTAMAMGLAQSLVQMGHIDQQHLGDTFRANYRREPWRGYASGPPTLFGLVDRHGLSYTQAASSLFGGQGSYGNGAAMRIAPVGLFFHNAPDLYEQAERSALITHAHPIGVDGAAVLARAIAQAVALDPHQPFPGDPFVAGLLDFARTPEIRTKMESVRSLLASEAPPAHAAHLLGQTVAAHQSVPYALYAFLRHPGSFEECLFCAILNGGDRDTLGAMACAVSGAYLGIDAIPLDWRIKLEHGKQIQELAIQLAGKKSDIAPYADPHQEG
jgi:poly(ADP-ribose) glycohydrolase ARH3